MKRFFSILSMLLSVSLMSPAVEIDGINYTLNDDGTAEVIRNSNEYFGDVVIPNIVFKNGKSYCVKSIGRSAFYKCTELISVIMQDSMTTIGSNAFIGCTNLKKVVVGRGVKVIENFPFASCASLSDVVWNAKQCMNFSDSLYAPFATITKQIKSIRFGEEVEYIPDNLCNGMSNISNVTLPNGLVHIGKRAFKSCISLNVIVIPESVTSIGYSAFSGCRGLKNITIPTNITRIEESAFYNTGLENIIWNAQNCGEFSYYGNSSYTSNPFYYIASQIKSFKFGEKVESIPSYLCYKMDKLNSLIIPNSVTSIGNYAFYGCTGLTSITIPNSVTSIGTAVFSYCSGLTSVVWNAKNCNSAPFGSINITTFVFGDEVESIPRSLCYGMKNLTSITIPNNVTSIGESAFSGCTGLTSIDVDQGNTKYDSRDNCDAIIETATNTLIAGCPNTIIPNSVTSIGYSAFSGCTGLTSITIPNSVKTIVWNAFAGCTGLTTVSIPASVENVGSRAFADCTALTSVYCYSEQPPTASGSSFYGVDTDNCVLYVPANSVDLYREAEGWREFYNIQAIETTALENLVSDNKVETRIILEHGRVIIIMPDGRKFTVDGKRIK